ncbi:MAG: molybdopterin-dependent oxidoreductase [Geminicoccaceae bacterium]
MLIRRLFLLQGALALGVAVAPVPSMGGGILAPPQSPAILTVTGAIANTNAPGRADFDIVNLEHLGLTRLITWTPWTEGEVEFEGVLARRLMEAVGATGTEISATALNGYAHTIPIGDFHSYDVLLAFRMNGTLMRVRDKGPIWIVYPWSDHPELDDFVTREKSIWQLIALDVR